MATARSVPDGTGGSRPGCVRDWIAMITGTRTEATMPAAKPLSRPARTMHCPDRPWVSGDPKMNQPLRNDIPRTTLAALFAGIIGGLLAFGLVGLFVGPVVLAVAYTLLDDWTHAATSPASGAPGDDGARAVGHERAST